MHPFNPIFDFGAFPTLETRHLVLRRIVRADADDVMAIKGDEAVTRYNGSEPFTERWQVLQWIDRLEAGYADHKWVRWGVARKPDDTIIGMVGYNRWVRADFRADIGYILAQAYWGQGIMPEALQAALDFGFGQMALNRVEAETDVANLASIRVLQKLGFRNEGFQLEKYYEDGAFRDIALFALLRRHYLHVT